MKTIIFLCHGSICRSPAAEWVFKSLTNNFKVYSRALTTEEIGNDIYPPMKVALNKAKIKYNRHSAMLLTSEDIADADYIFYMDKDNELIINHRYGFINKFISITKFNKKINEIEDPWYTGRYDLVLEQIIDCCKAILENIK